mgnify:FL=1
MKAVKGILIAIAIIALAAFATVLFMPVDGFVAEKAAKAAGYDVPEGYSDTEYRYYYNNLNNKQQLAYRIILAEISDFPKEIVIPVISENELQEMFMALSYDNPEIFFLGNRCSMTSIGKINNFVPQYLITKEEYEEGMKKTFDACNDLLREVKGASDYEKELFLHDKLAEICDYEDSNDPYIYTMYGTVVNHRANCEGYSRTMQYLLTRLGIENHLVIGEAQNAKDVFEGHMWNAVKIDGKWYNLDATWDDYILANGGGATTNEASHAYFNISTEDLSVSHKVNPNYADSWKMCTSESKGYYKKNGTLISGYGSSARQQIKSAVVKEINKGNSTLEIAFTDKDTFNKAHKALVKDFEICDIYSSANYQLAHGKRIADNQVVYIADDTNLIIRLFLKK